MSADDPEALARQLRAMDLRWRLARAGDPTAGDAAILELRLRQARRPAWRQKLSRQVAAKLATAPDAEPLAQEVAKAVLGAIDRPEPVEVPAAAAQVLIGEGAQTGDITTGDIAGRDLIKVTVHVHLAPE